MRRASSVHGLGVSAVIFVLIWLETRSIRDIALRPICRHESIIKNHIRTRNCLDGLLETQTAGVRGGGKKKRSYNWTSLHVTPSKESRECTCS